MALYSRRDDVTLAYRSAIRMRAGDLNNAITEVAAQLSLAPSSKVSGRRRGWPAAQSDPVPASGDPDLPSEEDISKLAHRHSDPILTSPFRHTHPDVAKRATAYLSD